MVLKSKGVDLIFTCSSKKEHDDYNEMVMQLIPDLSNLLQANMSLIEELKKHTELSFDTDKGMWTGPCVFLNNDGETVCSGTLMVAKGEKAFFCPTCQLGGNLIFLARKAHKLDHEKALLKLAIEFLTNLEANKLRM